MQYRRMVDKCQVGHLNDVSDGEWVFGTPHMALRREDVPQVIPPFAGGVQCGALFSEEQGALVDDAQRSAALARGVSADAALEMSGALRDHSGGLRSLLREFAGHKPQPTAMGVASRTLQSPLLPVRPSRVFNWKRSGTRKPDAASFCCRTAEYWSEDFPGAPLLPTDRRLPEPFTDPHRPSRPFATSPSPSHRLCAASTSG